MSLTDDINKLPVTIDDVMPGHLGHHATIHSALKEHNSRLSNISEGLNLRLDTTVGTRIFAGSTMLYGDTGWRDITTLFSEPNNNGNVLVRRLDNNIMFYFNWYRWDATQTTCQLPGSWGSAYIDQQPIATVNADPFGHAQLTSAGLLTVSKPSSNTTLRGLARFLGSSWPVTLPGLPG